MTERALQSQVMNFMDISEQWNNNHHTYKKNHSTITAMIQISDSIFEACNKNEIITLVTLDQSAAFDVLDHDTLIAKLELYNFGPKAIKWFRSYLSYRSNYVKIGTKSSSYRSSTHGVPQGSVLGPIMYIMYINELPAVVNDTNNCQQAVHKSTTNLFTDNCDDCGSLPVYADDATYVVATKTRAQAQLKLTENTTKIAQFLTANSLSINLGKAELLEIMVRQKRTRIADNPPQLTVIKPDGQLKVISTKDSCRLLGSNLNADISWKHHLFLGEKAIIPILRSTIGALSYIGAGLPKKSKLLLANGFVISRVSYLISMWGGISIKDSKTIQILLNKCARSITNLPRKTRTRTLMENCRWLYFTKLVQFHSILAMWKIVKLGIPYYLRKSISVHPDYSVTSTIPRIQTTKKSFKFRTITEWNLLPQGLRDINTYDKFKPHLRKHIIESRQEIAPRRPTIYWD